MSSFCVKFCGLVARFFSHHDLLMMLIDAMCSSSIGLGPFVVNSTVRSSIFFGTPEALEYTRSCEVGSAARWNENTTSSAVNGVPSWDFTPGLGLKRHTVGTTSPPDN